MMQENEIKITFCDGFGIQVAFSEDVHLARIDSQAYLESPEIRKIINNAFKTKGMDLGIIYDRNENGFLVTFSKKQNNKEILTKTSPLKKNGKRYISESKLDDLLKILHLLHEKANDTTQHEYIRNALKRFKLPDPRTFPEAWRISENGDCYILFGISKIENEESLILPQTEISKQWDDSKYRVDIRDILEKEHLICDNTIKRDSSIIPYLLIVLLILVSPFIYKLWKDAQEKQTSLIETGVPPMVSCEGESSPSTSEGGSETSKGPEAVSPQPGNGDKPSDNDTATEPGDADESQKKQAPQTETGVNPIASGKGESSPSTSEGADEASTGPEVKSSQPVDGNKPSDNGKIAVSGDVDAKVKMQVPEVKISVDKVTSCFDWRLPHLEIGNKPSDNDATDTSGVPDENSALKKSDDSPSAPIETGTNSLPVVTSQPEGFQTSRPVIDDKTTNNDKITTLKKNDSITIEEILNDSDSNYVIVKSKTISKNEKGSYYLFSLKENGTHKTCVSWKLFIDDKEVIISTKSYVKDGTLYLNLSELQTGSKYLLKAYSNDNISSRELAKGSFKYRVNYESKDICEE